MPVTLRHPLFHRLALGAFVVAVTAVGVSLIIPADELPPTGLWDKLEHAIAFAGLMILGTLAFPERRHLLPLALSLMVVRGDRRGGADCRSRALGQLYRCAGRCGGHGPGCRPFLDGPLVPGAPAATVLSMQNRPAPKRMAPPFGRGHLARASIVRSSSAARAAQASGSRRRRTSRLRRVDDARRGRR